MALPTLDAWLTLHRAFLPGGGQLPPPADKTARHHVKAAGKALVGYSFVQTNNGYFGLAPPDALAGKFEEVQAAICLRRTPSFADIDAPKIFAGDIICVLLGCDRPNLLRETTPDCFRVIGPCFVYGLHDAIGLLGPLPPPWQGRLEWGSGRRTKLSFFNTETQEYSDEDPRLGDLGEWERIEHEPEADDPEIFDFFRNKRTGEIMNSDPRMLPEALKTRGVDLRRFSLI
jgi:hypothetical protein